MLRHLGTLVRSIIIKRSMIPSARQQALAQTRERQRLYREGLVLEVEAEVDRQRVEWERARQEQLVALRLALSRALAMVGDGQKQAVTSVLTARETALRHGHAWQTVAAASVLRQKAAQAAELEHRSAQVGAIW
jgi:hypothetical protein